MTAYYPIFPIHTAANDFPVVFLDPCLRNIIKSPEQNYNFVYQVGSPKAVVLLDPWQMNMTMCAPLTYQASQPGGADLPSFITFDDKGLSLKVQTTSPSVVGTYHVVIQGSTRNYSIALSSPVKKITVSIQCTTTLITPTKTIRKQTVYIKQQPVTVTFGQFQYQPICLDSFLIYDAKLDGQDTDDLPPFLNFNSFQRTFKIDPAYILKAGTYSITVTGTVGSISTSFSWDLVAEDPKSLSLTTSGIRQAEMNKNAQQAKEQIQAAKKSGSYGSAVLGLAMVGVNILL